MRSLMIDKIIDINELSIKGQKYLSINEDIYEHHFPNNPVMPAAYMTEAAIQLSRIYIWKKSNLSYTLFPVSIKKMKFNKLIQPGDILELDMSLIYDEDEFKENFELKAKVNGKDSNQESVFEGNILFRIVPFDALHNKNLCENYLEFLF
ncbi:hypothetical protein M3629_23770 [Paenibacillus polysaccharolyticus]|uniref:3-hydroxyacyl-ACP dehydratase FabZ family protein n=1 Tax=Paenibacillus polysaccharolyticus TaxID=582692 RepID=UPI0020404224|nr:FabA/FabZ family ACP-dehydratase [Paenibacillus polysaccharolyticus]MCM3135801.1 hypothetical protein [Paenibacillus polysaccharolyticus]